MTGSDFSARILEMQQTLFRVSYSILRENCDREDAVSECIFKAWKNLEKLRDERLFRAWVLRILVNECYTLARRRKREVPAESLPEAVAPPDADLWLHDALLRLPETLRTPVVLHYMEGYAIREIAKILRLPQGTVKTRMRKARLSLKELLKEEDLDAKNSFLEKGIRQSGSRF